MNRRDDYAGPLFATDSKEGVRSSAYGRPAGNCRVNCRG